MTIPAELIDQAPAEPQSGFKGAGNMAGVCEPFKGEWEIDRSEWADRIAEKDREDSWISRYMEPVVNQSGTSCCVACATTAAVRGMQGQQWGMDRIVRHSPMALYYHIDKWGEHGGAIVSDAIDAINRHGLVPEDTPENIARFKHTYHQCAPWRDIGDLPSGWQETADLFKGFEFYWINSKTQFMSAVCQNWAVVYGRSGHSICGCQGVYENGQFLIKYLDSYGPGRGDGGFLYDSENAWNTSGAFCVRNVPIPPEV